MRLERFDPYRWLEEHGSSSPAAPAKVAKVAKVGDSKIGPTPTKFPSFPADPCERARAIARHCEANGFDLSAFLAEHPDLVRYEGSVSCIPARSIVAICQRAGVVLKIDPATGDVVVGRAGAKSDEPTQPWPSLLVAIEAHLDAVAALVKSGWRISHKFSSGNYAH
jgi:hypothetical protein